MCFVISFAYSELFAAFMCPFVSFGEGPSGPWVFLIFVSVLGVLYVFGVLWCFWGPQCLLATFVFMLVRFSYIFV